MPCVSVFTNRMDCRSQSVFFLIDLALSFLGRQFLKIFVFLSRNTRFELPHCAQSQGWVTVKPH